MDTLVEILAAFVVAMAAAALGLFGVRVHADHMPAVRPPVVERTSDVRPRDARSATPIPLASPAAQPRPLVAECPMAKARRDAAKA